MKKLGIKNKIVFSPLSLRRDIVPIFREAGGCLD
jgi:hypothetical protein